ncbi:hypothetical protein SISSUDRAFT_959012, partial [Sistotremastrum suecicum HHB10207 ss-3]
HSSGVKRLLASVEGLTLSTSPSPSGVCDACARGRIHRLPFPRFTDRRASYVLERVHSDIGGPLPFGYSGAKYFILFIDDY